MCYLYIERNVEKVWGACYTLGARYLSKNTVIEIGRYYGMEMNVEKTKVMGVSIRSSPVTIMMDKKQLENVECFEYLGSM